jgi:superfamily II DNA helicase RecQ
VASEHFEHQVSEANAGVQNANDAPRTGGATISAALRPETGRGARIGHSVSWWRLVHERASNERSEEANERMHQPPPAYTETNSEPARRGLGALKKHFQPTRKHHHSQMQIKIFFIHIPDGIEQEQELNLLLKSKKILQVEHHVIQQMQGSYLCVFVKYLDQQTEKTEAAKVDYQKILEPEVYKRFNELRDIRKAVALAEGVSMYIVFTNEELAAMAKVEPLTLQAMAEINGIGEKKIAKYGHHFHQNTDEKTEPIA